MIGLGYHEDVMLALVVELIAVSLMSVVVFAVVIPLRIAAAARDLVASLDEVAAKITRRVKKLD